MSNIIDRVLETRNRLDKEIQWWEENKAEYEPMLDELEAAGAETAFTTSFDVRCTGDRAKLVELMRILRRHGYDSFARPDAGKPEYFAYWRKDNAKNIWLAFTSTYCRRVQVGTEYVEMPKYEIHCGEAPPAITEEELNG